MAAKETAPKKDAALEEKKEINEVETPIVGQPEMVETPEEEKPKEDTTEVPTASEIVETMASEIDSLGEEKEEEKTDSGEEKLDEEIKEEAEMLTDTFKELEESKKDFEKNQCKS